MGALEANTTLIYGIHLRESANDGSDFSNGASDYRVLFLGEDGLLHLKDSAGTVTTPSAGGAITGSGLTMATDRLLGRDTASTGAIEEITIGSGLSLSGGALSASGGAAADLVSRRYVRTGANYSITGAGTTTFADIDATNLKWTFTSNGKPVFCWAIFNVNVGTATGGVAFDIDIDGTKQSGGAALGLANFDQHATTSDIIVCTIAFTTAALSAGSRTLAFQWRQTNTAHTAQILGGSGGGVASAAGFFEIYGA